MRTTALDVLWVLHAVLVTTQGKLKISPWITAQCDQQVTLNCDTSGFHDIKVKHMAWFQDKSTLCSVDQKGNVKSNNSSGHLKCDYSDGRLSLTFSRVLPVASGQSKPFLCKQRSNQGADQKYTRVELQECSGTVDTFFNSDGPSCTFNRVYPDGDIHWFHGSHNLSSGSVQQYTTKSVDAEGWLTIRSYLDRKNRHGPYNCSLKSTTSGRYIASAVIIHREGRVTPANTGVRSQEATVVLVYILTFFAAMKYSFYSI